MSIATEIQNQIPLRSNIQRVFGLNEAETWFASLPARVAELEKSWNFVHQRILPDLSFSYVAEVCGSQGQSLILKLGPPGGSTAKEIDWYLLNPVGTPRVLASDRNQRALLLQRIQPGHSLKRWVQEGRDDDATLALARMIQKLQALPMEGAAPFAHVSSLAGSLKHLRGRIATEALERAEAVFRSLAVPSARDVVLHGDLHHDNVLIGEAGDLVAIDPHGYCGPKAFEVGPMINNPYGHFPTGQPREKILRRRLKILSDHLPFTAEEICAWAYAYTLLSAAWTVEDGAEIPTERIQMAMLIHEISLSRL